MNRPAVQPTPTSWPRARNSWSGCAKSWLLSPARQAEAFWLASIDGHDCAEVARRLGTSPGSARVLVHRARTALAAALAPTRSDP